MSRFRLPSIPYPISFPEPTCLRVLALTKGHVGSGNEIVSYLESSFLSAHAGFTWLAKGTKTLGTRVRIVSLGHQNVDCRSYCGLSHRMQGVALGTRNVAHAQFITLSLKCTCCHRLPVGRGDPGQPRSQSPLSTSRKVLSRGRERTLGTRLGADVGEHGEFMGTLQQYFCPCHRQTTLCVRVYEENI